MFLSSLLNKKEEDDGVEEQLPASNNNFIIGLCENTIAPIVSSTESALFG